MFADVGVELGAARVLVEVDDGGRGRDLVLGGEQGLEVAGVGVRVDKQHDGGSVENLLEVVGGVEVRVAMLKVGGSVHDVCADELLRRGGRDGRNGRSGDRAGDGGRGGGRSPPRAAARSGAHAAAALDLELDVGDHGLHGLGVVAGVARERGEQLGKVACGVQHEQQDGQQRQRRRHHARSARPSHFSL